MVNLVIANENGDTIAELGTTKDHPFKLVDGTWGVVDTEYWKENHSNLENTEQLYGEELNEVNLKVGDKIQSVWGSAVLKDIVDTGEEKDVYNILKVGNFYTEGVVAHNKRFEHGQHYNNPFKFVLNTHYEILENLRRSPRNSTYRL